MGTFREFSYPKYRDFVELNEPVQDGTPTDWNGTPYFGFQRSSSKSGYLCSFMYKVRQGFFFRHLWKVLWNYFTRTTGTQSRREFDRSTKKKPPSSFQIVSCRSGLQPQFGLVMKVARQIGRNLK